MLGSEVGRPGGTDQGVGVLSGVISDSGVVSGDMAPELLPQVLWRPDICPLSRRAARRARCCSPADEEAGYMGLPFN